MSAEIIDLRAWRREHRPEHRAVEHAPVKMPLLVPTWPWGWLLPVLIEVPLEQ